MDLDVSPDLSSWPMIYQRPSMKCVRRFPTLQDLSLFELVSAAQSDPSVPLPASVSTLAMDWKFWRECCLIDENGVVVFDEVDFSCKRLDATANFFNNVVVNAASNLESGLAVVVCAADDGNDATLFETCDAVIWTSRQSTSPKNRSSMLWHKKRLLCVGGNLSHEEDEVLEFLGSALAPTGLRCVNRVNGYDGFVVFWFCFCFVLNQRKSCDFFARHDFFVWLRVFCSLC